MLPLPLERNQAISTEGVIRKLPVLVLLAGLGSTALVTALVRQAGVERHHRIESSLIEAVRLAVSNRLEVNIALLAAVKGLFETSGSVRRQDFARFVQTAASNGSLRGIQGVGFSRAIPAEQLGNRERAVQAEGYPDYRVHPAGRRPFYSAIELLEPFDWRNRRAFGFDMYAEPVRRAAMQQAMRTGRPSLSGKVELVQETKRGLQAGSLLYLPIRKGPKLLGWAYSPLRLTDLIGTAINGIEDPTIQNAAVMVYDGERPEPRQLLFDNRPRKPQRLSHMRYEPVTVAGRPWLVGVEAGPQVVAPNGLDREFWWSLLGGLAATTLLSLSAWLLVRNQLATGRALALAEQTARDRALASTVFEASGQGIVVTNARGVILQANGAFSLLSGYSQQELQGRRADRLPAGLRRTKMGRSLLRQGRWQGDFWNRRPSGELRRHHLSINAVRDPSGRTIYYVAMLQDITHRHQAEEEMRFRALHDPLTGLGNRQLLMEQLHRDLALAQRHHQSLGLLFVDLDGFKAVNDHHGHAVGDRVLQQVGERFHAAMRQSDLLARIGGDEFVVLVPQPGGPGELRTLAAKLVAAAQLPLGDLLPAEPIDPPLALSASVGIACYPEDGDTADALLRAADHAMYAAKQANRNGNQEA